MVVWYWISSQMRFVGGCELWISDPADAIPMSLLYSNRVGISVIP